ncbi:helix-turn-helix domain-containing protein [Paragemmobacter aquarius]|uniref:helix-turn-helix domain-containing protein n=1 Tax=Paragemmobacter aquarius TaxID=2169400 RepID=UPI001C200FB2|nr:helix-turn-helix transcriptional regulator [Gemmobacter aquarius]
MKNMKLCVNNDWLRRQIETDADNNVEAGRAIRRSVDIVKAAEAAQQTLAQAVPESGTVHKTEAALSLLVQLTRRRDKLTLAQFAERLRISAEEVAAIETDPGYSPKPRTIHNLAEYVKVPAKVLLNLLPDAPVVDLSLDAAVHRFAASSDNLSELSRSERRGLNDFVKFLTVYKGGSKSNAE